jgi:hypothetical protein
MTETEARLNTHEAVCAERYLKIELQFNGSNARLKRIESLMITSAAGVISGFGSIIFMLFQMMNK